MQSFRVALVALVVPLVSLAAAVFVVASPAGGANAATSAAAAGCAGTAYVTNEQQGTVSVIKTATGVVSATLTVGVRPEWRSPLTASTPT